MSGTGTTAAGHAARWRALAVIEALGACLALGGLLFAAAGTIRWAGAWVWLADVFVPGVVMTLLLDPELLRERATAPSRRRLRRWDAIWAALLGVLVFGWFPAMALDAARYGWTTLPLPARALGAVVVLASNVLGYLALAANVYASPVVQIQHERHQTVATGGPYGVVRHPMYSGVLLFFPATALVLGSGVGLALSPVLMAMVVVRTVLEDRMLHAELDGYRDYAARVRYRLVPHVW